IMGDRHRGRGPVNVLEDIQWLLDRGILHGELRDEIYVQICKQLTKNPNSESVRKGWELLCVMAVTFPPSKNFEVYLMQFVSEHFNIQENQVDLLSKHVHSRLTRICKRGPKGKVLTLAEIERAKEAPFNPSVFGESLEFVMELQKKTHPELKLPRILPFLADAILELKGQSSEGIFRVPGDAEFITELKLRIEKNRYDISGITDPNVPSSLLKFWLRDLVEPLIPTDFYDRCIKHAEDKDMTIEIVKSLPEINKRVVVYTIDFLQKFDNPETVTQTKMNVHNLAMCFAPNFLRCPSDNLSVIFENTKYEQA
ncbi:15551_t:CDS:2, partial [Acaulospora morrowiae]